MSRRASTQGIQSYILNPPIDMRGKNSAQPPSIDANRISALVQRARDGDKDAFADLYRACQPGIYRFARFHLPESAVDDAVSETFLRAWKAIPRYRDTGAPFAAWLAGIARHIVADFYRTGGRSEPRAEVPDRPSSFEDGAIDRLGARAAVGKLPKDQHQVIELKFLVGCSNEEVAKALGKSPGAVNALQWRALASLRKIMGPR